MRRVAPAGAGGSFFLIAWIPNGLAARGSEELENLWFAFVGD
jgi:hypothetical protein